MIGLTIRDLRTYELVLRLPVLLALLSLDLWISESKVLGLLCLGLET